MDAVWEVLSKPSGERTDEDIGQLPSLTVNLRVHVKQLHVGTQLYAWQTHLPIIGVNADMVRPTITARGLKILASVHPWVMLSG